MAANTVEGFWRKPDVLKIEKILLRNQLMRPLGIDGVYFYFLDNNLI
jgi:hypothetical protein